MRSLRQTSKLAVVIGAAAWLAVVACSSSSSNPPPSVTCGDGTVQQGDTCVAAVPEAGPGVDGAVEASGDDDAPARDERGELVLPPTFAGVKAIAPVSDTRLLVVWDLGIDTGDQDEGLAYRVYAGPSSKPLAYDHPTVLTLENARTAYLDNLTPGTKYVVGVRALNEEGLEDTNTVTLIGTPQSDSNGPTFAGLKSAQPGGGGAVQLAWSPASDDMTPATAMTYLVFMSDTAGGEDFTAPAYVSGPGDPGATIGGLPGATKNRYFVVRARDAAGNVDQNTNEIASTPGPDTTAPRFGGCSAATTVSAATIAVSWTQASDGTSASANITYDIFAATKSGGYDFTQPFATVKGTDTAVIPGLVATTRYYFVCRAKDEAANEDGNTAEVSALTGNNAVPPTFAGISTFAGDSAARSATIGWNAATDDTTSQDQIVYDVYVATATGAEAFNKPPFATSAAGATTITVTNLPPNATVFVVVRARDADGNHDANTVEKSMQTNVSFVANVQPIFTHDCGVVGCHVPGNPTGGLILAPGFAYAQIVSVNALELAGAQTDAGTPYYYVNPGDPSTSYLNMKINAALLNAFKAQNPSLAGRTGTQMPAPSTGSTLTQDELNTIANWIAQGAANN